MTDRYEVLRKAAEGAARCEWLDVLEAVKMTGDQGEGEFVALASPTAILKLLSERDVLAPQANALHGIAHVVGVAPGQDVTVETGKCVLGLLAERDALAAQVEVLIDILRFIPHFDNVPGYTTGTEIDNAIEVFDAARKEQS